MLIGGTEYKLQYNLAGEFAYERHTGHRYPYADATLFDECMLFYSMLVACNEGLDMTFDKFIEYCNQDLTLLVQFRETLANALAVMVQFKKKLETEKESL